MNQQKMGEFLKRLRREKGLTQEQLAEKFYVSSRTVSRWETGSNMPDVGTLIELADFYDVDIREIIDGERKSEMMDKETKDTLKKVAAYTSEGEKRAQSKVMNTVIGVCIALLVYIVMFIFTYTGRTELLAGMFCIGIGCALIFYLRVRWFMEKPTTEPEKTVMATVASKEVREGTNRSGRSMMGYSFVVNFQTEDGQTLELYAYEIEFGGLKEGMKGMLTYKGRYFVSFSEKTGL